jgi:hypothetical protein
MKMPRGIPTANETIEALRSHFNRGAAMGGPMMGPGPAGANMRPQSPARGGATAGLAPNPSHGGNPPLHGTGAGMVPNTTPGLLSHAEVRASNFAIGHATSLLKRGHKEAQTIIDHHTAKLDRHAVAKRNMAAKASQVKAPRGGLGSLGGAALSPEQGTLMSQGNQSAMPSGDALETTRNPLQQRTSGGSSQVQNASSGPGYDY